MSYEGYTQHICENGHRFDAEASYFSDEDVTQCHCCQGKSVWHNDVDETNDDSVGYIPDEEFKKLLISEMKVETCNLGHQHITHHAIYRLPKENELQRYYRDYKNQKLVPL